MNPYSDATFFKFLMIFFFRMYQLISGNVAVEEIASDEIQIFVLLFVAISSSLVGGFLILKKMTMLANSLSHTILLGIVLAYLLLLSTPFQMGSSVEINLLILIISACITALITAILSEFFTHFLKLQEDASVGLVFTTFFALGIVLVTLFTRNTHIGTEIIMGNIDILHLNDLKLVFSVALFNAVIIFAFFKKLQLITFDSALASSLGYQPRFFGYLLMVLTACSAISAFRAVGVLLFLAFLVGPYLTARLLTDRLSHVMYLAIGIGSLASIVGVALSRHLLTVYEASLSTSSLVVCIIGALFILSIIFRKIRVCL